MKKAGIVIVGLKSMRSIMHERAMDDSFYGSFLVNILKFYFVMVYLITCIMLGIDFHLTIFEMTF